MKKLLVSAPPPTANGDLHVGHLSGPFLRADLLTKYSRMRGREVYCVNGADEHQSYVAFMAEKRGQTPLETVDKFSEAIRETLKAANIDCDIFLRPSRSPEQNKFVQDFLTRLYETGKLVTREEPALYCEHCKQFLFEVYVYGKCPHCDADASGNSCEGCGRPNDCIDLKDPRCNRCNNIPTTALSKRLYFPLSVYEQQLRSYYSSVIMNARQRAICDEMLAAGLPEIVVTFPADWGIPVPVSGFEGQVIYGWFEVAAGVLAATQQLTEKLGHTQGWEEFWKADDAEVVQFCGFDNGYFYGMLIPALLMAFDADIKPARAVLLNEFYYLDGLKFSTSRNHAIWGKDLLARSSPDAVRFYLSLTGPESAQTNFTLAEFEAAVERELVSGMQGWLQSLGKRLTTEYNGVVPAAGALNVEQEQFLSSLQGFMSVGGNAYEPAGFSPRQAASTLIDLVRSARDFSDTQTEAASETRDTNMVLELTAARALAILAGPMMPEFSARVRRALGDPSDTWEESLQLIAGGTRVQNLDQPYFTSSQSSAEAHSAGQNS